MYFLTLFTFEAQLLVLKNELVVPLSYKEDCPSLYVPQLANFVGFFFVFILNL